MPLRRTVEKRAFAGGAGGEALPRRRRAAATAAAAALPEKPCKEPENCQPSEDRSERAGLASAVAAAPTCHLETSDQPVAVDSTGAGSAAAPSEAAPPTPAPPRLWMPLTKYERTHALSQRALELAAGAEPLVFAGGALDPLAIAVEEMQQGKLNVMQLVRALPSGESTRHPLHELAAISDSARAAIRKWTAESASTSR